MRWRHATRIISAHVRTYLIIRTYTFERGLGRHARARSRLPLVAIFAVITRSVRVGATTVDGGVVWWTWSGVEWQWPDRVVASGQKRCEQDRDGTGRGRGSAVYGRWGGGRWPPGNRSGTAWMAATGPPFYLSFTGEQARDWDRRRRRVGPRDLTAPSAFPLARLMDCVVLLGWGWRGPRSARAGAWTCSAFDGNRLLW